MTPPEILAATKGSFAMDDIHASETDEKIISMSFAKIKEIEFSCEAGIIEEDNT